MAQTTFRYIVNMRDADSTTNGLALAGTLVTATAAELNTMHGITSTTAELNIMHGVTATATQINNVTNNTNRITNVTGSTSSPTLGSPDKKVYTLNRATGIAVTLPSATGSGSSLRFLIGTSVTSNTTTFTCASSQFMQGYQLNSVAAAPSMFYANGTSSHIITLNGSTQGGLIGDSIDLVDIAAGLWQVAVISSGSSVLVTCFS